MADVLAELRAAIAEDEYESTNLPEKDIKDAVDQYIHLLTVNFTDHSLEPNSQFIDACVPLFVSRAFEEHGELITFHVFEKLEELINASDLYDKQTYPDSMWVVLSLCVLAGEVDNKVYQKSDVSDLLPELKAVFLTGYRNGDYQTQLPALTLAYKLCQHVPQRLEIIACADQEFIQFLLDYIQYTRDMADEAYNYAATKLVLAINSQFSTSNISHFSHLASYSSNSSTYASSNKPSPTNSPRSLSPAAGSLHNYHPHRSICTAMIGVKHASSLDLPSSASSLGFHQCESMFDVTTPDGGPKSPSGGSLRITRSEVLRNRFIEFDINGMRCIFKPYTPTPIMRILCQRHDGKCRTFIDNLVFLLNREDNAPSKIIILQLICQIFTTKKTSDIFYSNDLNVLVDIMIRELEDLPDDQEQLRQAYLIVLLPMLKYSQYKEAYRPYRLSDIELTLVQLLRHLLKCTDPIVTPHRPPSLPARKNSSGPATANGAAEPPPRINEPVKLQRRMSIKKAMPGWTTHMHDNNRGEKNGSIAEEGSNQPTTGAATLDKPLVNSPTINIIPVTPPISSPDSSSKRDCNDRLSKINLRRNTRKLVEKGLRRCREIKTNPTHRVVTFSVPPFSR